MLELSGVGHAYAADIWVFREVDLVLEPGSITAILGPNGRGKTTLLRCAAGLLRPREGAVRCRGTVGFVPQASEVTFGYRVLDMVLMGRARQIRLFGVPGRQDVAAACEAMEQVGVTQLAERSFSTLSGGEQQLVRIARAVASDSQVLALDEPVTGLDLHNQGRVLTLLRDLAAAGMTVLSTTHHPEHALYVADQAVLMYGPGQVLVGAARSVLTDQRLTDLYGIGVRTVEVDGDSRRVLVTDYQSGRPGRSFDETSQP